MHQEIEELIPILSLKFYEPLQMATIKTAMKEVISRNKVAHSDDSGSRKMSLVSTVSSFDSSRSRDPEDIEAWQKIVAERGVRVKIFGSKL